VCANAAAGGFTAIMAYAHERGCPLGSFVVIAAASNGQLEALKVGASVATRLVQSDSRMLIEWVSPLCLLFA
jgi:hypothetical protein